MARLAHQKIHASLTFGNSPVVDILASSIDGDKQIAIQVKSAKYAKRGGRKPERLATHLDWVLKSKAFANASPKLFFAFVDLWDDEDGKCIWNEVEQKVTSWQPTVYIISSLELKKMCVDWNETYWRFKPTIHEMEKFREDWKTLKNELGDELQTLNIEEIETRPDF